PGAAPPGLARAGDVEDPEPLAKLLQRLDEIGGHRDETALALDSLEHDARALLWIDVLREEQLEAGARVRGRNSPVLVGPRRSVDLRRQRPEATVVDQL